MNTYELSAAMEAVLFSSGEPMSIDRLSQIFELSPEETEKILLLLKERLNAQNSGIELIRLENTWQLATVKTYSGYIKRAFDIRRKIPLSPAALEVLAVIAYNQPVTKAFIEQVRGVDCSGVVASLSEKELIEEKGRLELPGRPLLYGTTKNFLRCFSISDLSELPPLPDNKQQNIGDIAEQLEMTEAVAETVLKE